MGDFMTLQQSKGLTIFYDGKCPLCIHEMRQLKSNDDQNVITLVDIHQKSLMKLHPDIKFDEAMRILHGKYQGVTLEGLEVTYHAWTLVGKGRWVALLNWPVLKPVFDKLYLVFARYRHSISAFFVTVLGFKTPQNRKGVCNDNTCDSHHRSK